MLSAVVGDITQIDYVSAVVSASTASQQESEVYNAIQKAAGVKLIEECRSLGACETGEAKITKAYQLPCQYIIHTVGPEWKDGMFGEEKFLEDCYWNCLMEAKSYQVRSIAFPAISTEAGHFPLQKAAHIAVTVVRKFLETYPKCIDLIVFVCYEQRMKLFYDMELK